MSGLERAQFLWAKTDRETDDWMSLPQHMQDSGDVAGMLWDEWLSQSVKRQLVQSCGGSESSARSLLVFLATVHDVGKATPPFQIKGPPHLKSQVVAAGFDLKPTHAQFSQLLPHGIAGEFILEDWLKKSHGWKGKSAEPLGLVVGGHHGVFPAASQLDNDLKIGLGAGYWPETQEMLLDEALKWAHAEAHISSWRDHELSASMQVILSACVILADWIASNRDYFDFGAEAALTPNRARDAWTKLGFTPPWRPKAIPSIETYLQERFSLPTGATARPVQRAALKIAQEVSAAELFIIEAPMGTGKTEAGLAMAEQLASSLGLRGVYYALPTMATSNAMFSRMLTWVGQLNEVPNAHATMYLAHSKAALHEEYRGLARFNQFSEIHDEHSRAKDSKAVTAVIHEYFSGRKKGLLADFSIGTIDQFLMMALKSKHLALRHLAFANKVVIVDEVHAADEYMSEYLERALEWCAAHGVPVILLSATLPGNRRQELAEAYDRGKRPDDLSANSSVHEKVTHPYAELARIRSYPLISATSSQGAIHLETENDGRECVIKTSLLDENANQLTNTLKDLLSDGGCALIVRNTVKRAQKTFQILSEQFEEVTLFHSRFISTDRLDREAKLLNLFGAPASGAERPFRHIVVATQVVEQSLDVDFDVLITDVAPIDLLLQRAGRLHRHKRERPLKLHSARMFITGVEMQGDIPDFEKGSAAIYGEDALFRSMAVLSPQSKPLITLPNDIPNLIQDGYATEYEHPDSWCDLTVPAAKSAESHRHSQRTRAGMNRIGPATSPSVIGWTGTTHIDLRSELKGNAAVRDGLESLEVIVVQIHETGEIIPWGLDNAIPTESEPPWDQARTASARTVTLPPSLSGTWIIDRTISDLEQNYFPGWQASRWLREQLVLVLDKNCQTHLAGFQITYSTELGLSAIKEEEGSVATK